MFHRYAPSALLVAIALIQITLAETAAMTPWKGGGFGMFSTLDHGAYRGVDAVIDGPDRSEAFDMPASLEEIAARAAAWPSDRLLRQLAQGIAARERRYERPVTRITITAWRIDVDRETLRLHERALRTLVYQGP